MADLVDDNLENDEEDKDLEKFSYLDDDNDTINILSFKKTKIEKIKIDKVQDYYDFFVSILKMEDKDLHTDEHLALRTEWDFRN